MGVGAEKRTGHQAVWLVPCRCGLVLGCLCVAPVCRGRCSTRWDDVVGQRAVGGSAAECFAFVERRRVCGWGPVCRSGVSPARAPLTLGCAPAQRGSPQVNPIFGGVSTSPIRHLFVIARRPYRSSQRQRPTALRLVNPGRVLGHTLDSSPPSNRRPPLDPCAQQDPHEGGDQRLPPTAGREDGAYKLYGPSPGKPSLARTPPRTQGSMSGGLTPILIPSYTACCMLPSHWRAAISRERVARPTVQRAGGEVPWVSPGPSAVARYTKTLHTMSARHKTDTRGSAKIFVGPVTKG